MRMFALIVLALLSFLEPSSLSAQKRVEVGIFLDYLNISQTNTNNFGVGGRFGYRIHRNLMMEGELANDYGINFEEAYHVANGNIAAIERTSVGVTHGLFGPTLQPAKGGFRPFVTLKGGFIDFRLSPSLLPFGGVVSTILGIRTSSLNRQSIQEVGSRRFSVRWAYGSNWGTRFTSTMVHTTTCGSHSVRSSNSEFPRTWHQF